MSKINRSRRLFNLIFILVVLSVVFLSAVLFYAPIIKFAVNNFTDYRLGYSEFVVTRFSSVEIKGFTLKLLKGQVIKADKIKLTLWADRAIREKQFVVDCYAQGAVFIAQDLRGQENDQDEISGKGEAGMGFTIPIGAGQRYDEIKFSLNFNGQLLKISDIDARSEHILVTGDYALDKSKEEVIVNIKISFSPKMASTFNGGIKKKMLTLDDKGWYSAVINYKGNALLFKALYSLAF